MIKLVSKIKTHILINSAITIILGVALLVNPNWVYHMSVNISSMYMLVIGLINIVDGIREKNARGGFGPFLAYGSFYIILAAIIYFFSDKILQTIPFLLGLVILLSGFSHLFQAIKLQTSPGFAKKPLLIYSVILIGIALLFIFVFTSATNLILLFKLYGAVLIIMGGIDVFFVFYLKKMVEGTSALSEENR